MKNLDEVFKLMKIVEIKTNKPVKLTIYHDGSGNINHDGAQRSFGSVEILHYQMKTLDETGSFAR